MDGGRGRRRAWKRILRTASDQLGDLWRSVRLYSLDAQGVRRRASSWLDGRRYWRRAERASGQCSGGSSCFARERQKSWPWQRNTTSRGADQIDRVVCLLFSHVCMAQAVVARPRLFVLVFVYTTLPTAIIRPRLQQHGPPLTLGTELRPPSRREPVARERRRRAGPPVAVVSCGSLGSTHLIASSFSLLPVEINYAPPHTKI